MYYIIKYFCELPEKKQDNIINKKDKRNKRVPIQ